MFRQQWDVALALAQGRQRHDLERQAIELEKVGEALEHDPAFASELAKLEFASGSAGGERIAVSEELRLGGTEPSTPAVAAAAPQPAIPAELLEPLASGRGLRTALLATAAGLVLIAFLFLNETQAATVRAVLRNSGATARSLAARYRKPPEVRDAAPVARHRNAA